MTSFSRQELARARLDKFAEVRTPGARTQILHMIENLARTDRESTPENDRFRDFALCHFFFAARDEPSIYPVLRRVFGFGLELPEDHRKALSPRLDLSAARTYSDAAKAAYTALLDAARPDLVKIAGDLLPPDAATWPVKLD